MKTRALKTPKIRRFEEPHARISRMAATEGIVLLENNGILPLEKGGSIALYGKGAEYTIKGGSGSGEVNSRHNVSIREGLESAGYTIATDRWLSDYDNDYVAKKEAFRTMMRKKSGFMNLSTLEYVMNNPFQSPEGMLITDKYLANPEVPCIYVISRQAGESMDRMPEKGDFLFSDRETENLNICRRHYRRLILVINVGGYMDLSPIDKIKPDAVIFFCQQGAQGGHAFADILTGDVTPSGHLSSTWPSKYEDVPCAEDFSILNGNTEYEEYREGIYMGYRYFDSKEVAPRYPFGYGLSYTDFKISSEAFPSDKTITVDATVQNTGKHAGKAVVQVYVSCPDGCIDKEYQRLAGFAKTHTLSPGESESLKITFPASDLASFAEEKHAWIMEPGEYIIRVGSHSRDTAKAGVYTLDKEIIMPLYDKADAADSADDETSDYDTANSENKDFDLVDILNPVDLISLCMGTGMDSSIPKPHEFTVPGAAAYTTDNLESIGIPAISFCDGPAGLRLQDISRQFGKSMHMTKPVMEGFDYLPAVARALSVRKPKHGKTYYQYATAFPVGMSIAQSWNTKVASAIGHCVQREMKAFGVEVWLAPGMNLHRNPLCGRNYEYFSEDPLLSGRMAASITKAVQSKPGYAVTIKHFCCNNQEINRMNISANASERTLRELYLRNFEIAVKEGHPLCIMTSYNKVNGTYSAENEWLLTQILRKEWGFDGVIMTDWTTTPYMLDAAKCLNAGVNMMMPGIRTDAFRIKKALKDGSLSMETLKRRAQNVLDLIRQSKLYNENRKKGECRNERKS